MGCPHPLHGRTGALLPRCLVRGKWLAWGVCPEGVARLLAMRLEDRGWPRHPGEGIAVSGILTARRLGPLRAAGQPAAWLSSKKAERRDTWGRGCQHAGSSRRRLLLACPCCCQHCSLAAFLFGGSRGTTLRRPSKPFLALWWSGAVCVWRGPLAADVRREDWPVGTVCWHALSLFAVCKAGCVFWPTFFTYGPYGPFFFIVYTPALRACQDCPYFCLASWQATAPHCTRGTHFTAARAAAAAVVGSGSSPRRPGHL